MKKYLLFLLSLGLIFPLSRENISAKTRNCNAKDFAIDYVRAYNSARTIDPQDRINSMAIARCQQAEIVRLLESHLGNKIGYKVGITNKKAQQQTGINSPVVGVLLEKMLLPNGSTIAIDSGARLIYEVDLLVKIKSENINNAETIMEVARNIEAVYPFIEVPDLMLPPGVKLSKSSLVAINVGARWGVIGEKISVSDNKKFLQDLAKMQVSMYDESGKLLTRSEGKNILGNPLNSVLFLISELNQRGEKLNSGDLVSLGTFGRFHFAKSGKSAIAVYQGIDDRPATVLVKFK